MKLSNPEADEDDGLNVDLDYNRVKIKTIKVCTIFNLERRFGASFKIGLSYESNEVEETEDRFINTFYGDQW